MTSIRYSVRSVVSAHPTIYLPLVRRKYARLDRIVRAETELVIDGFERSGNWFAVAAFLQAQRRPRRLAHHLHAPAQVASAVRLGIPTILLVRNPEDAIASQMIRTDGVQARQALVAWIRYHKHVLSLRDHVVVADFDRVTTDFGGVIDEVNVKFGTEFGRFESTPENVRRCFAWIEDLNRERYGTLVETAVARPSAVRNEMKLEVVRRVRGRGLQSRRDQALGLYEDLINVGHKRVVEHTIGLDHREQRSWVLRRLEPANPRGLPLSLATVIAGVFASILANLTQGIRDHEPIVRLDDRVAHALALHRDPTLTAVMRVVSWLGAYEVVVPLGVIVSAWFVLRRGDWSLAARLLVAIAATTMLSDVVQNAVSRARPTLSLGLAHVSGWAFPAERAAVCVAFYGVVTLFLSAGRSRVTQVLAWVAVAFVVLLVGVSRIYVERHWLSDVVAGYALGGVMLSAVIAAALLARGRRSNLVVA